MKRFEDLTEAETLALAIANEEEDSRHHGDHGIGKELDLTDPARRGSGDPSRHIRTSQKEVRSPVGVVVAGGGQGSQGVG